MNIIEQHRAVTHYRQAFHDMPVGGPMDGAAYGEYLKSKGLGMIIGVVSAAAAVVTGGATLAAWGAASTAQLISAGAMVAGGVMSGVGAVTGNQKLMKIGGVLSLAGGIGGALTGTAFSKGLLEGSVDITKAGALGSEASSASAGLDTAKAVGGEAAKTSTEATLNLQTSIDKLAATDEATFGAGAGAMTKDAASSSAPLATPQGSSANLTTTPGSQQSQMLAQQNSGILNTSAAGGGSLADTAGDAVKGVGSFVKNNKEVVELGGKILQGAMSKGPDGAEGNAELQAAKARQMDASARAADASASANLATANATNAQTSDKARTAANANAQVVVLNPKDANYAQKKAAAEAAGYRTVDMVAPASSGPVTMGGVNYGQTTNQWASAPNGNINIPRSQR